MGADLAEAHVGLDLAAVKLAVGLGAALLDLHLGALLQLLGGDRRLAARDLDQLGRLLVRDPARVARQGPDHQEPDAAADHQDYRRDPVAVVVVHEQQRE